MYFLTKSIKVVGINSLLLLKLKKPVGDLLIGLQVVLEVMPLNLLLSLRKNVMLEMRI